MEDINKIKAKDVAYASVRAVLASIPIAGAAASELLGLLVAPPLEKRRAKLMQEIGERLKEIESKDHIDLSALSDNNQFIDIVLQATNLALKTSQEDKIEAFKNIILNSAKGDAPDETKCQIFLSMVDSFTAWHLKVLHLINNPEEWYKENNKRRLNLMMGSLSSLIIDAFPELKGEDELIDLIWQDLYRCGLHKTGEVRAMMTGDGIMSERTTSLGREFIEFISQH